MKLSYSCFALSLGFVVGCGTAPGASNSGVGNDNAALSETATESADLAASLGQDNVTMSQTGFGGVSDSEADEHAEIVGALLHAAINPGGACVSGTVSITLQPIKTASCADIGLGGKYFGGATVSFAKCVLPNGATIDGSVVLDETRELAAGQTCSPTAIVDVTRDLTIPSLSFTSPSKYTLSYANVSASVTSEHAIGARPTSVTSKHSGERKIADPKGTLLLDQSFDANVTVTFADATATSPASATINGTATVVHHLAGYTASVALKDVEKVRTCCKPIAGSITLTKTPTSGTATTATLTFGPLCGEIALDGKPLTVAECL
jgi:hypothetical protein